MPAQTKKPQSKMVRKPVRNVKVEAKKAPPPGARAQPLSVDQKPAVKKAMPAKAPAKPASAVAVKPSDKTFDTVKALKAAATTLAAKTAAATAAANGSYVLEDQIGFRLRKAHQRATTIFAEVMAEFDVTPTQFAALAKLDDLGPISQNQLGRLTAMDPATILGVVGRLHRSGWLRARPSIEDQRLMLIELTPEGVIRIKAMKEKAAVVSARTLSALSAAEAQTLNELLARLS